LSVGWHRSPLFEIAHKWLESIPDIRIVCNVDLAPEDMKVAQLREARMLGRWIERSIKAESLLNRERYQRPGRLPRQTRPGDSGRAGQHLRLRPRQGRDHRA